MSESISKTTATAPFTLAMVQMRVEPGCKQANLDHASECIAKAAAGGARVVVLPEAMPLGWTHPCASQQADPIPDGESCQLLCRCAQEYGVYLCAGVVERAQERIFNSAVLIDPTGRILLHHRKINELQIGHPFYALGDRLQVVDTNLGRFGLMICADGFARGQVLSRALAYMGADIILSPSAWAVLSDHDNNKEPYAKLWLDNYGPVAREFRLWIVGVSNVGWITAGPWQGRKCIGSSLAVNPNGLPAAQGIYGHDAEQIINVNIQLQPRPAQGDGWDRFWTARER